jgi:aryl-alcohol dehydrogenase-like predicted oxidoreductase
LTDGFSHQRAAALAPDDWRRRSDNFNEPRLSRNIALRDALRPIAARHQCSVSAIAIAWASSFPGVTAAIVGARSPEQVDGWLSHAALELSRQDRADIHAAIAAHAAP